jgi:hypothetical protein
MRTLYHILFICFATSAYSQSAAEKLVTELNNNQFIVDHSDKARFSFKSKAATKLIRKGKKASGALIKALDDPDRNIMAHLVLCHIYFKHASFAGPKIASEGDHNVYKYFLGREHGEGLIISEVKKGGSYSIYADPEDIKKAKEMWAKIIKI